MTPIDWQLQSPISAVVFDCDGTLSRIEGINFLAETSGALNKVTQLTDMAMTTTGINPEIYSERLRLVLPHYNSVIALGKNYYKHKIEDIEMVLGILKRLDKTIYLVSAGVNPAVQYFGSLLRIPASHIYAVDLIFSPEGQYLDFDHTSPLIHHDGKRNIIKQIKAKHTELVHVGDGLNDLAVHDLVTRFIGYGGAFHRPNIAKQCRFYIRSSSIAPLLPLSLTHQECEMLTRAENKLYRKGLHELEFS